MSYKRNRLLMTLSLLMLCSTTSSNATPTCTEVIAACDKAIQRQALQIQIRDREKTQTQLVLDDQAKLIEEYKRSDKVWYNQKWLWLIVGAGATAYILKH